MSNTVVKPFLIEKDAEGQVHLTVRETHYNSQGYPWVRPVRQNMAFQSVSAARAYAVENFGAKAGEFTTKK